MAERSPTKDPKSRPKPEAPTWVKVSEAGSTAQGWYKATRTLDVEGGTIYQTTTEHRAPGNRGGHMTSCSEALVLWLDVIRAPCAAIMGEWSGEPREAAAWLKAVAVGVAALEWWSK